MVDLLPPVQEVQGTEFKSRSQWCRGTLAASCAGGTEFKSRSQWCRGTLAASCAGGTEFKSRSQWCCGTLAASCAGSTRYGVQIPVSPQALLICSCNAIDRRVEWLRHTSLTLFRQPHGSPSRMYEKSYMRDKWEVAYITFVFI